MTHIYKIFSLISLVLFLSCNKQNDYQTATLIKNCTGDFARINNNDYLICNNDVVNGLKQETELKIKYDIITECENHQSICYVYHPYKATIFITKIKS